MSVDVEHEMNIAPRWRRLVAFAIDGVLLGTFGFVLGLIFFDALASLGWAGRLVGFAIGLLYFGFMNSSFSGGQTTGKLLTKIAVVDRAGRNLNVARSSLRYAALTIPFFMNVLLLWPALLLSTGGAAFCVIIYGGGLAIIYLFLFNRRTGQSLHDLLVGSFVITVPISGGWIASSLWRGHYVAVSVLAVLAALVPVIGRNSMQREPLNSLLFLQASLEQQPEVRVAAPVLRKVGGKPAASDPDTHSSLLLRVLMRSRPIDYDSTADQLARTVFQFYPRAHNQERLIIIVAYGYDIGISSRWETRSFDFAPDDWQQRMKPEA